MIVGIYLRELAQLKVIIKEAIKVNGLTTWVDDYYLSLSHYIYTINDTLTEQYDYYIYSALRAGEVFINQFFRNYSMDECLAECTLDLLVKLANNIYNLLLGVIQSPRYLVDCHLLSHELRREQLLVDVKQGV